MPFGTIIDIHKMYQKMHKIFTRRNFWRRGRGRQKWRRRQRPTLNSCNLAENSYFELIFSPKYSQRVPLSNEVSYDGIQIIFQKVDFFSVAGVGSPATFSKCVPWNSNILLQKFQGKKRFFTEFFARLYPVGLIPPPPQ